MADNPQVTPETANLNAGGTLYRYIDDSRRPPYIAEYKILKGGDVQLLVSDGSRHRSIRREWIDNPKVLDPFSSTRRMALATALDRLGSKKALLQRSLDDVHKQLDRLLKLETAEP